MDGHPAGKVPWPGSLLRNWVMSILTVAQCTGQLLYIFYVIILTGLMSAKWPLL